MKHICPNCAHEFQYSKDETLPMTKRMRAAYDFIAGYMDKNGIPPSLQEIADGIGLKHRSGAHRVLDELSERGLISKRSMRARSIRLLA